MSINTNWQVEKYKYPFESEEHWKLKKEFLLAHKSNVPEEQLVCLAQVYVNVKLLGCRYPAETMKKISALGVNLGKEYKEMQKTRLQRTFVKASDAAEAKIMRAPKRKIEDTNQSNKITKKVPLAQRPVAFVKSSDNQTAKQKAKEDLADTQEPKPPSRRKWHRITSASTTPAFSQTNTIAPSNGMQQRPRRRPCSRCRPRRRPSSNPRWRPRRKPSSNQRCRPRRRPSSRWRPRRRPSSLLRCRPRRSSSRWRPPEEAVLEPEMETPEEAVLEPEMETPEEAVLEMQAPEEAVLEMETPKEAVLEM
ncbi:putative NF-kappa-B-repressing factor-like [Penaeus vannamei]|uniref:Putative NF-kappa-B-repressing factor-like n=1 Tax=Penaeus vannamei TaxID=6689 RepID=A0A423UB25_PENVA|nr:putative NF-kappa-B-repressing factor-like [Penaeus vannamei]